MVIPNNQPSSTDSEFSKNSVTSHKIALLVLIKQFCIVKQNSRTNQAIDGVLWKHSIQQTRDFSSTILKLIMEPDISLRSLIITLQTILHPQTYKLFSDRLNDIRKNSIDSLFDLFATLNLLFLEKSPVEPIIQKRSILGIFIRRMLLAFDKLTFSSQTKLYRNFYTYFDAAFETEREYSFCDEHQIHASQRQAEFFLAQQASILQINECMALSPLQLQCKINQFIKENPELFEAYFLTYLNSMRVKDYSLSKKNLIHHFDRNTTVPQECKSAAPLEDLTISSRYAALNLAIMHAIFEHKDEAVSALNEAIMLAQEVNDNTCLQYALAWLYRFTDENREIMIKRSIATSAEIGLWSLSSLSMQSLVKLKSETIDKPVSIFELLAKVDLQNCKHSLTDMMGSTYMLRTGLWSYYGHSQMELLSSQTLLCLDTNDQVHDLFHIGEGICLAFQTVALALASKGFHGFSSRMICLSCELFSSKTNLSSIWKLTRLITMFEKLLYKGKWSSASDTQTEMSVFDYNEARLRKVQLLIHKGNLNEADSILKKFLTEQESKPISPYFYIRTLLLRAELLAETSNKEVVLEILMTCLAKSKAHHLLSLEYLTTMQIAACQLELGLPQKARNLLNEIVVFVMCHGSTYDKGCFCYLYSRCLVYRPLQNLETDFEGSKKELLSSVPLIDKALVYFMRIQAIVKLKRVLSYKAHMYHCLGMEEERNNISNKYKYIEDEFVYDK